MAGSVNKVILVGNLGRDPEVRSFANGGKVVNLRIATSESWRDKASGERRERTEWHSVAIFSEPVGNIAEKYLRKGSKVYVAGKWQTRKWQDQSGQDRYSTECVLNGFDAKLVMLDGPSGDGQQPTARDRMSDAHRASYDAQAPGGGSAHFDDDIPFACDGRM